MATIILTFVVFSLVILLLTVLIIAGESKLINKGDVVITINDDAEKEIKTQSGKTLLSTLKEQDILLPSACGGQGTCGVCECIVEEGGGDLLPTETTFITRKKAKVGYRLTCQLKVKDNLKIKIPEEIFSIKSWECEVVSNKNVATFIKEFIVRLPESEDLNFKPGGYIQIQIPHYKINFNKDITVEDEYREDWEKYGIFGLNAHNSKNIERAYSMASHPAEGNIVKLNVRIATPPFDPKKGKFKNVLPGIASSYIFSRNPGDKVTISGPYGEFFISDTDREMVYIGGGAGMAPLRSHIFHLFHTLKTKRKVSFWYGARSVREIFYKEEFEEISKKFKNFDFSIALSDPLPSDNWDGYLGFIHQALFENYLINHPAPEDIEYYLCGPPVMNKAVLEMLDNLGVEQEMIHFDDFGG